ncbi:MAG: EAL domain-containing protein [Burkholderiaceae bacterium]|nr:EAL domain-containing protein [Burkholderiaceae bacterium]
MSMADAKAMDTEVSWYLRLHRALLPDYNRKAAAYWYTGVLLGGAVLVYCLHSLAARPERTWIEVALGVAIAMLAALFPVQIPRSKNSLAAGEIFIFLLLLLHGPEAAALASAGEATLGAWRISKRWSSRIASPAMAVLAMFASGSLLQALRGALDSLQLTNGGLLIVATMVFALCYFVCNTLLITTVHRLKRSEPLQLKDLVGVFGWVGIIYTGSAAVAALLYLAFRESGLGVVLAVVPIIGLLMMTLHYFFRQQEANEAVRRTASEAAAREAEAATRHMEALQHIAFHDSLTGLPNRHRFNECLAEAIGRSKADLARRFAVLFIDFDRFKLINDSLGHSAGDEFLVQAAQRIRHHVRPTDVVARLGGDEFGILAENLEHENLAVTLAERLMRAIQNPFVVGGTDVTVTASIGITFGSTGYNAPDEALRDADIAMYKAKENGKARYAIFDIGLHAEIAQRLRLEGDLRNAIANGDLSVVYQPLFDLGSGGLIGFEALARWHHPQFGTMRPEVFIPIAEESGLIISLTDLMLQRACRQLRDWQLRHPRFADLRMHVNISAKDVGHDALVPRVTRVLRQTRLQPRHLTLELTENILMEHIRNSLPTLAKLQALGIGLSVDDFGTGYSSLSHLSALPIDTLKVDRSFVRDLQSGSKEAKVVRAIVHLGMSLDKAVVAEGIENAAQLAQLREMGCTRGQGFHLGYPQEAKAVRALLARIVADSDETAVEATFEHTAALL